MKKILVVVLFFPIVAFAIAGYNEARSNMSVARRIGRLIPIICGIAAFLAWFNPLDAFQVTPADIYWVTRIMAMVCALIACSGVFLSYSRRSSAIWVALGGLVLALYWTFNRVLV